MARVGGGSGLKIDPTSAIDIYGWSNDWAAARGLKTWRAPEIGSTNTIAKNDTNPETQPVLNYDLVSPPTLYITANQTQGRGRGDHVWAMPPGASLLSSWSFAVAKVPQPIFSPLVGLALFRAASAVWPEVKFNLKAPNDLFIGPQKTAGLLIETVDRGSTRHTIVGLGLNVNASPPEILTATHLAAHLKVPLTAAMWMSFLDNWRTALAAALAKGLNETLSMRDREDLCRVLNLHPHLREPILSVDASGQLISATRTIYWHEL